MELHCGKSRIFGFIIGVTAFVLLCTSGAFANSIQYAESEAESSTTNTAYQTKTTLTFTPAVAGDYLIFASAELKGNDTGRSLLARLRQDGTTTLGEMSGEPDEADIYIHHFVTHRVVNLTAASHTLTLEYTTENAAMTAYIRRARIVAVPLDSYSSAEDVGPTNVTSTTYTTIASTTFTPGTAQNYLLVATAEFDVASATESISVRADIDGTDLGTLWSEAQDTSDRLSYASVSVRNLTAASHTFRIQARDEATNHSIQDTRVTAIPLNDNLFSSQSAATEAYTTNNSSTYADITTLTFTPSEAGTYYMFTSAIIGGEATAGSTYNALVDFDDNGTEDNLLQKGFQDDTDRMSFGSTRQLSLSASSQTFKLRVREGGASTPDAGLGSARIIALSEDFNISGTVYTNEGTTNIGSGKTVSIAVDGVLKTSVDTDSSGSFKVRIPDAATAGSIITVWLDDETENGVTVTETDGSDIVLNVYQNRLIVRHDNAASLTNNDLDTANNTGDSDISAIYTLDGSDNLTMASATELFIWTGDTYVPGATIDAYDIDINGTLSAGSYAVTVEHDWDSTSGTFTHTGTVTLDGAADQTVTMGGQSFYNLTVNNTGASGSDNIFLVGTLDVDNDITITNGDLDQDQNNANITVAGDWTMGASGSLDSGADLETVTFDGVDQSIYGTTTFNNLTKSDTSNNSTDAILTVQAGTTQTINGTLNLNGLDANDQVNLVSTSSGTFFTLSVPGGNQNVSQVSVQDSHASNNDILATFSTSVSGNDDTDTPPTDQWIFASTYYWVGSAGGNTNNAANWSSSAGGACGSGGGAGTPGSNDVAVFQDSCDNNVTVNVNMTLGAFEIQTGYAGTITPSTGVLIDVNGTFTQAAGTINFSTNNTSLKVAGNFLKTAGTFTAGTGTTTFDGTLTVNVNAGTNLGNLTVSGSPDVAATLLSDITVEDLTIGTGDGLVTDGYEVTVNDDVMLGGNINAASGTDGDTAITVAGSWDALGGSFTPTGSLVTFTSTGSELLTSNAQEFNNITFNGSGGSWELQDDLHVQSDFTITNGTVDVNALDNNNIVVGGDWDNSGTFTGRSGTVTFDGTAAQTIAHSSGTFYNVAVTNGTAAVTFSEAFTATNFTNTTAGSVMRFQQSTTFTISGTLTLTGASGDRIDIDSVNGSTQFTFNVTGAQQSVTQVAVANSAASSYDIVATSSLNNGGNDDGGATPHWVFPDGAVDYMQPDVGTAGMRLVVQFVGSNFTSSSTVTTGSSDIIVGPKIVTNTAGTVVTSGGRVLTTSFFIKAGAANQTVTVSVDGVAAPQTFKIVTVTNNDCDYTGVSSGTTTLGNAAAGNGDRTAGGTIICDDLIIDAGHTVIIDKTDPDATIVGNQGYLPAVIVVDGNVTIAGQLNVNGSAGAANSGDAGGAGGAGGPGGGGGGAGGGQRAIQTAGGAGFSGAGGGSCETDNTNCEEGYGGDGSGSAGGAPTIDAGDGGTALVTSTTGGGGGSGDTADGAGGGGGTGFPFGSGGGGGDDGTGDGAGGSGGGGGSDDGNGGGGGFGTVGTAGDAGTAGAINGNSQLTPWAGGSGGGGGGSVGSGGGGGGGAGGAVVIYASGTITVTGTVASQGGNGTAGTDGDGGSGSGGSVVLQAGTVTTSAGTFNTSGATGGANGGNGRIRVDGVPAGSATIGGTKTGVASQFTGPAITSTTSTQVVGVAAASATIDVYWTNGITSSSTSGSSNASGGYAINVTWLEGLNYVTVTQDTGGSVEVMSSASLSTYDNFTISGTCDQLDESTDCADDGSNQVRVAYNGSIQAQVDTTVDGAWTISGLTAPASGTVITVFIDGNADANEAVAVTKYDGSGSISGVTLYQQHLTIGSDDTGATITNADLALYDNSVSADEDIFHEVDGNNDLTVDTTGSLTNEELHILSGWTFRPDSGSSGNVSTQDIENKGAFTADGNTVSAQGNWVNATGTFTAGTSTVVFNGTAAQSIIGGGTGTGVDDTGKDFNNVTISNTSALVQLSTSETEIDGTLQINASAILYLNGIAFDMNGVLSNDGTFRLKGSENVAFGTQDTNSGTWEYVGDGSGVASTHNIVDFGTNDYFNLVINDTSATNSDIFRLTATLDANGSVSITDGILDADTNNANIRVAANWTEAAAGSFSEGTEKVTFDGAANQTITTNGKSLFDVILDNTGAAGTDNIILADSLDVNGSITITDGDLDPNTNSVNITVAINWIMETNGSLDEGAGTETVTFDGVVNQTITSDGEAFYNLVFNNTAASGSDNLILADALDANGSLTVTDGDLDPNTNNVNITVAGNWTMGTNGSLDEGTETVTFDSATGNQTITSDGEAFYDLVFNNTAASGSDNLILADALDANGSVTVTDGDLDPNMNNVNITVAGNWTMGTNGSLDEGTETVTFDSATGNQTITSDGEAFYNLVFNNTAAPGSDNLILADALDANGSVTVTDGDLDPNTNNVNITVAGNWTMGVNGSLDEGTETVTFDSATGNQTITSDGEAFYNLVFNNTAASGSDNLILADALDANGSITVTDGDLDPNTNNVNITVAGNWTMGVNGSLDEGTETVIFDSASGNQTITSDGEAFYNLVFNNTAAPGSDNLILADALDANGSLTVTDGDLDPNTNNVNITVAGNWTMGVNGSLDEGTETVTFDSATGNQTITSEGEAFYNVVFNNTAAPGSDNLILADALDANGSVTVTDGDLDPNTNNVNITVAGNWTMGVNGSLDEGTETVTFDSASGNQTITSDGEAFYNLVFNNTAAPGSDNLILADALDVNGSLTVTDGDLDPNTNNVNITVAGNWTMGVNGSLDEGAGTETVSFDGTADQTITSHGEGFNNVTLNNTGASGSDDIILADALDVNGSVIINNGNLDPNTNNINMTVAKDWTMGTNGSLDEGTETVTFDGTTDQTITSDGESFYNVTFNNTGASGSDDIILADGLDVNGTITVTDGNLDPDTHDANITVAGNWIMGASGSLAAGSGSESVIFDGGAQTISGTTSFNNLSKTETTNNGTDTVFTITAGTTQTIAGTLSLSGLDGNDRIALVSSSAGTFFTFNVTGADQSVSYLTVQDSHASSHDILATFSVSVSGNDDGDVPPTDQWIFASNYYWVGASNGANTNLAGSWSGSAGGACGTGGAGIPGPTDVAVFQDSCDNGATVDADFNVGGLQMESGYAGTITPDAGILINVDGLFAQVSGTLDLDTNDTDINFAGNVTRTGGTFNAGSGTATFDGTTILTSGGMTFNHVVIGAGGSLTTADAMNINGTFSVTNGGGETFNIADDTVNAAGTVNFTNLDTFTSANSTFIFDGTTTLTSNGRSFYNVQIAGGASLTTTGNMDINGAFSVVNGAGETFDITDDTLNIAGNMTLTNLDTFTSTNSTVIFDGTTALTGNGGTFNNMQIGANSSLTTAGDLDVNGTFTVTNGGGETLNISDDTIYMASTVNLTDLDTFTSTNSTMVFDGTTTLTSAGRAFNNVRIGPGSSLTTADNMDMNGSFTVTDGAGETFNITDDTVNIAGNMTLTNLDTFTSANSTVIFDGTTALTSNARTFNNVRIGGSGSLSTADTMEINGTFTVTNGGGETLNITDDTIYMASTVDLTNLDTLTSANSTVIFDGTTTLTSNGRSFNNVQIAGGASLATTGNMDMNGSLTVTDGSGETFDITDDTLNIGGNMTLTNLDTFTSANSTVIFDGTTILTSNARSFNHVQIAGGSSLTTADNMDINGALTVTNGAGETFNITDDTLNIGGDMTLTNLDTFTSANSTVIFDGTTTLTSNGRSFNNVQISGGASLVTTGNMDINGSFTVTDGAGETFNITDDTVNVGGAMDLTNLDTLTSSNSTVIFDGTTTLTSAGRSFYNLQIGAGGSLTAVGNMDINGSFAVTNGAGESWDISYASVNVAGQFDLGNLDTFTVTGSTVVFDGTAAQSVSSNSLTYSTLTVTNNTGTVTFDEAWTAENFIAQTSDTTLRFQQSTTFTVTNTLTLKGTSGHLLDIDSVNGSTQFTFAVTGGDQLVYYVDVARSNAANNDIRAVSSNNGGGNDDGGTTPFWIFLTGAADYFLPDVAAPGMNVVVNLVGSGYSTGSVVTTSSSDIVVGPTVVTNDSGVVVGTNGTVITVPLFISSAAAPGNVTITVDGADFPQSFQIANVTSGHGDFTGDSGTITLGNNVADHGDRVPLGAILLDELVIPSGLTVNVDVTDADPATDGNQGYMPVYIIVDGNVTIGGELQVNGSAGSNRGSAEAGGAGGAGGPGGGGGGGGGGDDGVNGAGGKGFTGGGGGSCDSNDAACAAASGGDGSGTDGFNGSSGLGGSGGLAVDVSLTGGVGGTADTTDGAGGGGGTGDIFGSSGGGGADPATNGTGGSGGGAGAFDGAGGGGGFGTAGSNGAGSTGGSTSGVAHLVPFVGGSGGGGGGATNDSAGSGGGGAGGSVIIYATGTITVTGTLSADGGAGGAGGSGGGGGSGGAIVLQSDSITTSSGTFSATGGAGGATGGGAGGDGRVRVDGVPSGSTVISGTFAGAETKFIGPAITSVTSTNVVGTATASADIDVVVTNSTGTAATIFSGTAEADGDFSVSVMYYAGTNYVTVIQETGGGTIRVTGSAAVAVYQASRRRVLIIDG